MLELHELNVFVQAAEALSFTAAAERLHISQPAVSMQISNLEKRLNTVLFDRSGRSIRRTEAAEVLLPLARELLSYSTKVEETMTALQGVLMGHLHIACSTSAGKYVLPHLIARFREKYPEVRVTVNIVKPEVAVEHVCNGISQLGVLSREIACREAEYRRFFTDYIVLIVPRQHPWAKRDWIEPQELINEPLILREEMSGTRRTMQAGLLEHDIRIQDLDVVMELGSAEAIEASVEAGIGVAFLSRLVAKRNIETGRIVEVPVKGINLKRELLMMRHGRKPQTRVQETFWDFVHAPENKELLAMAD